jgi:peptidoglycan/LPS O-acetylase OafA/YrhL
LGVTWGSIAVDIFFITSGFLVTGSLLYRQSLKEFLVARALRILPALWVSLGLTVLIVGSFFTNLSFTAFIADIQTWKFLTRNAVLLTGIAWSLPGAFVDIPAKGTINGSLWSLPVEVKMYLLLAGFWLAASLLKINRVRWVSIACVLLAILGVGLSLIFFRDGAQSGLIYLGAMFFSGAALRVLQKHIVISHNGAIFLLIALFASAALDRTTFDVLYRLSLPYAVLYLATVPGGKIRRFNSWGDYSYGMYIYAFPVQQAIAALWRGIDPYEMMATSFLATIVLAIVSWHLIEKRALTFKGKFS